MNIQLSLARLSRFTPYSLPLLAVLAIGTLSERQSFAATAIGKAVSVTGQVLVRNESDQIAKMRFLKAGDELFQGTIINTGINGAAKLLMSDKTILDLASSTLFKLDEYKLNSGSDRNVGLSMDYGKVRSSVNTPVGPKGKFTIRTRAATMGVRGTEFIVADLPNAEGSGSASTQVTVIHGKVEVKDAAAPAKAPPVALITGSQLTTVRDQPAAVVKLSGTELVSVRQAAVLKDMTFLQSVTIDLSPASNGGTRSPAGTGTSIAAASASSSNGRGTAAVLSEVSEQIKITPQTPPQQNDMRLPGTFGADSAIRSQAPQTYIGMPVSVRVNFNPYQ